MRNHIKLYNIETGNFKADGGAMFGVIPKLLWQKSYTSDENNLCSCACRSLLIDTGDRKILIDTGIGTKLDPDYAKFHYLWGNDTLLTSLNKAGFKPDDITDVILTHLHFDHCGGTSIWNNKGESEILFKEAKIWVSEPQWNWANNPNRREKPAYLKENLEPIGNSHMLNLVEKNRFIYPEIELRLFNGHTIGLMAVFINIGDRRVVFSSDLLPAIPYINLSFTAAYDINPLLVIEEKKAFLDELLNNNDILFLQHDINAEACTLTMTSKGIRKHEIIKIDDIS